MNARVPVAVVAAMLWGFPAAAKEGGTMETGANAWVVDSGGVGPVRLGRALPRTLLPVDVGSRYFARYIADVQPAEGFEFDTPPVRVFLARGPFARKACSRTVEAAPDAFRDAAVRAARRGAKVDLVMVVGPGPATAEGIGVGSRLAALLGAYPDLELNPVPPTLGHDECMAMTRRVPGVYFAFESCEAARAGAPVVRVDVWRNRLGCR